MQAFISRAVFVLVIILGSTLLIQANDNVPDPDTPNSISIAVTTSNQEQIRDGECSLIEALINADADNQSGSMDCPAGDGFDRIDLQGRVIQLNGEHTDHIMLPKVTGNISLQNGTFTAVRTSDRFLYVEATGTLNLSNITFEKVDTPLSTLYAGGIIYNAGRVSIDNSHFISAAGENGGAVYNTGSMTIENSSFISNHATQQGGAIYTTGPLQLSGNHFENNSADTGGAVYSNGAELQVHNCSMTGNSAQTEGGAIFSSGTDLSVSTCVLAGNSTGGSGGAISTSSRLDVFNSLLSGNHAGYRGGAIYVNSSLSGEIINTTLAGNYARYNGGSVYNRGEVLTINNTISQGNSPPLSGSFNVSYSLLDRDRDGYNIQIEDAKFVDPRPPADAPTVEGDYRLQGLSPAIDAGDNRLTDLGQRIDVADRTRFVNDSDIDDTGYTYNNDPVVDIGAYERQLPSCYRVVYDYTNYPTDNFVDDLIFSMGCANVRNNSTIDMGGRTAYLTEAYEKHRALPLITRSLTLRNGTLEGTGDGGDTFLMLQTTSDASLTLENMIFQNNNGRILYAAGELFVTRSIFRGNRSRDEIIMARGPAWIENSLFTGNYITVSGFTNDHRGIIHLWSYVDGHDFDIHENTITDNHGTALYANVVRVRLTDNVLWGNSRNEPSLGSLASSYQVNNYVQEVGKSNPLFVDPVPYTEARTRHGDYRLREASPLIDTTSGNSHSVDLAGNPRTVDDPNITRNRGSIMDIGAYEYQGTSCEGVQYPYILFSAPGKTRVNDLSRAIACANVIDGSHSINLNGLTVTLSDSVTGHMYNPILPLITGTITIQNGYFESDDISRRVLEVLPEGRLTLDNVTFRNTDGVLSRGHLTVTGSNFIENRNSILVYDNLYENRFTATSLTVEDSTFTNNGQTGTIVGSAIWQWTEYDFDLFIRNNVFSGNTADNSGGALYLDGSRDADAVYHLSDNIFQNNLIRNSDGGWGGAIYSRISDATLYLENNVFSGNNAMSGGALYSLTPMYLTNNLFSGNLADRGAAIYLGGHTRLVNNTISGNQSPNSIIEKQVTSTLTLDNTILWGNSGSTLFNTLDNITASYSLVEGGFAGTGNQNTDPLFVNPIPAASAPTSDGDYSLQTNSPAIDGGSNSLATEAPLFDLAGNSRYRDATDIPDTGEGTAPVIDIGAYECVCGLLLDTNQDGIISPTDAIYVINRLGVYTSQADVNGDGAITNEDVLAIQNALGE